MNVEKIKEIEKKIKALDKVIKDKSYYGAGVGFSIYIGDVYDGDRINNMEICDEGTIKCTLINIRKGLIDSLEFNKKILSKEIDEALSLGYYTRP